MVLFPVILLPLLLFMTVDGQRQRRAASYMSDFQCERDRSGVRKLHWCDGVLHCEDASDERYCAAKECDARRYFRCATDDRCIPHAGYCDGYTSCPDGSDEADCSYIQGISEHFTANVGEDAILRCAFEYPDNYQPRPHAVHWYKQDVEMPIYVWYETKSAGYWSDPFVGEGYEGRVSPAHQASLNLTNVRESDHGWYKCKIFFRDRPLDPYKDTWVHLDIPVATYSLEDSRGNATRWMESQRDPDWGWRADTPKALVGLGLSDALEHTDDRILGRLERELFTLLLRGKEEPIDPSVLSACINALLMTCHDPRHFYGSDLVRKLRDEMEKMSAPGLPLPYLTLCSAKENISDDDVDRLLQMLETPATGGGFVLDPGRPSKDVPPFFINRPLPMQAVVQPNAPPGTPVFKLQARDPDTDHDIHYFLVRDDSGGRFEVDERSGEVRTLGSDAFMLDKEYVLYVKAEDHNGTTEDRQHPSTGEERLSIMGGSRPPQFYRQTYEATIPKNQKKNADIIEVTAKSFADREIRYILRAQGRGAGTFTIEPTTGVVKLSKDLEYDTYWLMVTANEDSGIFLTNVHLIIRVTDVNDNAPRFPLPGYQAHNVDEMSMLQAIGVQALTLMALQCVSDSDERYSYLRQNITERMNDLKKEQKEDGSFGNMHTTALVLQALIASNQSRDGDWNWRSSIEFLRRSQRADGSFGDFLTTYLMMPILNGKSLQDVGSANCEELLQRSGEVPEPFAADLGSDVILRCGFEFPENKSEPYTVQWLKQDVKDPIYVCAVPPRYPSRVEKGYQGRVFLAQRASLQLSAVRESDQTWYECKVHFPGRPAEEQGSKNRVWVHLAVLAEPHCKLDGAFRCTSHKCVLPEEKCDGKKDCENGLDEEHCVSLESEIERRSRVRMPVRYSLFIGDDKDQIYPLVLWTPNKNATVLELMSLAADYHSKYQFKTHTIGGKTYVSEISNIPNDPESDKFWFIYRNIGNGPVRTSTQSPDEIRVVSNDDIILWFRTLNGVRNASVGG